MTDALPDIDTMSDRAKLDYIRRYHQPPEGAEAPFQCRECGKPWPCITAQLSRWEFGD